MSILAQNPGAPDPLSAGEPLAERRARLTAEHAVANEVARDRDNGPRTVSELIEHAGDLAALPQVVMQVIHVTASPHANAAEIERIIGTDQALTARILTLANSSYYGLPRRISSIREAVIFLGFKTVRSLAMTVTSFNLFLGKSDAESLTRRDLWKHSLNAGLCGRLIASALPKAGASEEVFTAALLHDIGKMLMIQHLARPFALAVHAARERGVAFHRLESEFLPFTHAEVGAALAVRWNLPPVLVEAIGYHHSPEKATDDPATCAVVALANDLTNAFSLLPGETTPAPGDVDVLDINQEAIRLLEIEPDALNRIAAACATELRAGSALCTML